MSVTAAPAFVVGSGIAGLRFSLHLAAHRSVVIITKKEAVESNTNYAQGGVAAVFGSDDEFELHVKDTLATGCGLSDTEIVRIVVTEGPGLIEDLIAMGASFARDREGKLALGREGGHSRNRVVHAADATGREIERVLLKAAESHPNITILPFHLAVDVIVRSGRVEGLLILGPDGILREHAASLVALSSGGLGRVFRYTTNPEIATGDGVAMGWRAGAAVRDMEFIQFHPTALARPGAGAFLISEAVRGEGGILRLMNGERFMLKHAPEMKELAPRDVVARAIDTEMKKRGEPHVFLDVTHLDAEFLKKRFPTIYSTCLLHGINIAREPIPVVPAAHYSCGGLLTDAEARTGIEGLFAVGETASHGLHGANRLASNSLLEALVFARRGAAAAARVPGTAERSPAELRLRSSRLCGLTGLYTERLNRIMADYVGIFRNHRNLARAVAEVGFIRQGAEKLARNFRPVKELVELVNMAQCAELVTRSAVSRNHSVGLHALEDDAEAVPVPPPHTIFINETPTSLLGF